MTSEINKEIITIAVSSVEHNHFFSITQHVSTAEAAFTSVKQRMNEDNNPPASRLQVTKAFQSPISFNHA